MNRQTIRQKVSKIYLGSDLVGAKIERLTDLVSSAHETGKRDAYLKAARSCDFVPNLETLKANLMEVFNASKPS